MGRIKIGNIKGPQGEAGKDFEYAKTYASVSAMNADYSGTDVEVGEYVIIDSGNNDADNGKVYRKGSNAYTYEHNIAGPTGPRGATGPMPTLYNGLDVTTPGLGALDAAVGPTIANKVSASGGEAGDTVASFTSADSTTDSDITAFTAMEKLTSGSALKTLMNIVSKAVKNIRWLKKKADAADTSISSLNDALGNLTTSVAQLRTLKSCTVNVANSNTITYTAGQAFCYYLSNAYVVVFMTLAFRATSQRDAGTSVFYLSVDGRPIAVSEPYNIPCIMTKDNIMRFCGYNADDRKYFTVPSAWSANTEARYSGVFFGNLS